jgi:HAD superfamily hydrolase (TIGR01509 family)
MQISQGIKTMRTPAFDPRAIQAVLFDLDGTLIDTDDVIVESWASRLAPLARVWPRLDPQRAVRRMVMASEGPINRMMTLLDVLGLDRVIVNPRKVRLAAERPVPGVVELVKSLAERFPLGVVTSRGDAGACGFLNQVGIAHCFHAVVTTQTTWRIKPHPEPVRRAALMLDVPAEVCLMVGDTPVDIQAARRAGAWACGVLCGFGERAELERAGAHLILESTALLSDWL